MPQGVQSVTINVLGKDREFRASMRTFREVRETTGINMLSANAQTALTEKLDTFLPALLFAGLRDREGIESADWLADELGLEDLKELAPQVMDAMGMKTEEKNEQAAS